MKNFHTLSKFIINYEGMKFLFNCNYGNISRWNGSMKNLPLMRVFRGLSVKRIDPPSDVS